LSAIHDKAEASPVGPDGAAKHIYQISSAKAHAEYDSLSQYGTVEDLAQAMEKFIPDVRMLAKLPDRAAIEYACRLMMYLGKNV
jgi:hypothetical protein